MKKLYYVSVQGRSVLEDATAASYEWVIEADEESAANLRSMLERVGEQEESSFRAFTFPWPDTPENRVNSSYQSQIDQIYRQIYRLGTSETRSGLARIGYGED